MSDTYNWLPGNLNQLMPQGGHRSISREDIDASGRGIYEHKQYSYNKLIETNLLQGVTRWKAQIIGPANTIQEGSSWWAWGDKSPSRKGYRIRIPEIHQTIPFPCDELDDETKKKYLFMHPEAIFESDPSLIPGADFSVGDIVWITFGVGATANRFREPVIQGICQKGVSMEQVGGCGGSNTFSPSSAFVGNPVVWTGTGTPPVGVGGFPAPRVGNYIGILSDEYPQVANGCLPDGILVPVDTNYTKTSLGPVVVIDAVDSWNQLAKAFKEQFGVRIKAGQFMRYYDDGTQYSQVQLKIDKGNLAATPGTSNHGWALAVDIDLSPGERWYSEEMSQSQKFASEYYVWLSQNASNYGWHNPAWARQDGSKPEPWHWEYINANSVFYPR